MNKQEIWILFYEYDYERLDPIAFTDETDALEVFMALCDEELYETFFFMTQDEYEKRSIADMALYVKLTHDIGWQVERIPCYGNFSC